MRKYDDGNVRLFLMYVHSVVIQKVLAGGIGKRGGDRFSLAKIMSQNVFVEENIVIERGRFIFFL